MGLKNWKPEMKFLKIKPGEGEQASCYVWRTRIVHFELLPRGHTVTTDVYSTQLGRVNEKVWTKQGRLINPKGVLFLRGDAVSCKTDSTKNYQTFMGNFHSSSYIRYIYTYLITIYLSSRKIIKTIIISLEKIIKCLENNINSAISKFDLRKRI